MFSNLDYLYQHLPGRMRRDDEATFLRRFVQFFGEQLDLWDGMLDEFHLQIAPETAEARFIRWWLWALFGWSWYPDWFRDADYRALYGAFTRHLGRRGTAGGIEEWLRDFSVHARAFLRPVVWGEAIHGEGAWGATDALGIVVQVSHVADRRHGDVQAFGELVHGEGHVCETRQTLTRREIEDLVRFSWPIGNRVFVDYRQHEGA